ncbi:hypothetical protein ILUMI_16267 [Ignelater luminosus]|uniref:Uncharacterized protein n=1 Tax=Ignelater luminosus TaxID=2038154 RepID=A0A8K0G8Q4_IGNLU|nr:hypothetical protein ILUMI_16267 [Ignelater luminosus]
MKENSITILQAPDDADSLIVSTVISYATTNPSVLIVGEDVDIMVLMVALTPEDKDIYLFKKMKIFNSEDATEEKIAQAEEELTRVLYKGKKEESIDRLRYVCFT